MKKGIIGKKIGMTQLFDEKGNVVPVTVIEAGPCFVVQKKTIENDGYNAVQLAFDDKAEKNVIKPAKGHFDKANVGYKKVLREFKLDDIETIEIGQEFKADTFEAGEKVDITGTSKGKGYQGAIKRFGTSRIPMSHGAGPVHRSVGSTGNCSDPSRVFKGKKMAGHMGNETVTVQDLDIIKVDAEKNIIAIKGAIPGPKHGVVIIKSSVKNA